MALPIMELLLRDGGYNDADSGAACVPRASSSNVRPLVDIPDADVIDRIRAGDVRTFERLYEAYATPLFDFARAYLHDAPLAEEVVATVLGNLWTRRANWTVRDRIEPYLFGAVHREILTMQRTTRRRAALIAMADDETRSRSIGHAPVSPDTALEQAELEARVWQAVDALPVRYRVATVLRWRRDMSYDEIAQVLEVSSDSARQLVSRAVRMIRERLGV